MKTLNALSLRRKFGGVLDEICREKEPVVITRANKPLVVMVSYEEYEKLTQRSEEKKELRRVFHRIKEWSDEHEDTLNGLNAVQMIREIRQGK
jgi:prevent-host-death family protein